MLKISFYKSPKFRALVEWVKKFRFLNETETLKNYFSSFFLSLSIANRALI